MPSPPDSADALTPPERESLLRMEAIAESLPAMEAADLDAPLREFFTLLKEVGMFAIVPASRLLERAAERCTGLPAQLRLYHACARLELPPSAEALMAPQPSTDDALTGQETWELTAGMRIRVKHDFTDFDGRVVAAGTELTFVDGSYFPYDGGHTWYFDGLTIRLAEISGHEDIIENRGGYWFERVE